MSGNIENSWDGMGKAVKKPETTKSWKQRKGIDENICILGTAPPVSAAVFLRKRQDAQAKKRQKWS